MRQEQGTGHLETFDETTPRDAVTGFDIDALDAGFWNDTMAWMVYEDAV